MVNWQRGICGVPALPKGRGASEDSELLREKIIYVVHKQLCKGPDQYPLDKIAVRVKILLHGELLSNLLEHLGIIMSEGESSKI